MTPVRKFGLWTSGTFTISRTYALNPSKRYLLTGALTQTSGDDYSHIYISEVCRESGDVTLCGVRDFEEETDLNLTEFISNSSSVTFKLRSTGGRHRAEGVLYEY